MKEKKKNETKKMIGEIAILLILMGLTFSVLLRNQDLGEVVASVFSVRKRWLIPAVLCMVVYIFCGGLCIRVMQHGLGHKMSIARCFKYSFVEFYFSAITPSSTGGQPMQLVYMKKDGYNVSESSVILVAITAMYKLSFVLLCLLLFLSSYLSNTETERLATFRQRKTLQTLSVHSVFHTLFSCTGNTIIPPSFWRSEGPAPLR